MLLQSKNVEMDQLQEQLLAEITQELLVKELVLVLYQSLHHQLLTHVIVPLLQFKLAVTDQPLEQLLAEITLLQHAKEDVTHNLLQIHVTAPKQQLENVDLTQLLKQLLVEIKHPLIAKEDVQHLNLQLTNVIALLNLLENAVTDQPLEQLLAEEMQQQHANKDVLLLTHVIAKLNLSESVEMDQLQEQLLAEITLNLNVKTTVILNHLNLQLKQTHVIAKLKQLKNVETDQLLFTLLAEIKKLLNVLRDVHHQPLVFNVQLPVTTILIAHKILATF
jgi:hypothetical protein